MVDVPPADRSLADRSLADRVDAIERALTDESTSVDASRLDPSTTVGPERVETLEADLTDLSAAVDALRGVVGELDRRDHEDSETTRAARTTDERVGTADGGSVPPRGPLYAPTGREIQPPAATSATIHATENDSATENDPTDGSVEAESPDGVLERISDAL